MTQSSQSQPFLRIPALPNGRGTMAAFLALLLGIFAGYSPALQAQNGFPPSLMSYQGFLVDANGAPLAPNNPQNFSVVFRIYGVSSAGTALWTEAQTVTIDKGNFSVVLGEGGNEGSEIRPNLATVFNNPRASDLYIGITVKGLGVGNPEILPRLRLLTSPYAFLARTANSLAGSDGAALISSDAGRLLISQALQSTGTGGNARGANAVDLQVARVSTSPSQVASGTTSVISGGQNNTASGELSAIAGGSGSTASGKGSAVGGGENNTASGLFATVPGGRNNVASGENSFAVGRRARATHPGSVVFGDNSDADKNSSGDNQFLIQAGGGVGINGAPAGGVALTVNGEVSATSARFGSVNATTLSATSVSGFGTVPVGGIIIWSGNANAIPAGWALCDGRTVNANKTPDLRGRFVLGALEGSTPIDRIVGGKGGSETVTLTEGQLPAHNHAVKGNTADNGAHTHRFRVFNANFKHAGDATEGSTKDDGDGSFWDSGAVESAGLHAHSINLTSTATGKGEAINIMPPFYALAYIMRVQ
ncbi:MAG: tail fiber protein [Verrucomicrobia bacterium]|nr:tail fiber protein [Verrucomicrobiota bacterium]